MNVMLLPKAMQMVRGEHFAPWRRLQVSCEFVFNEEIFQVCAILLLCYLKDVIAEWPTASFVAWRSLLGRRLRRLRCSRAYCLRSPRRLTCSSAGKQLCCLRYWTLLGGRLWRKIVQGRIACTVRVTWHCHIKETTASFVAWCLSPGKRLRRSRC